MDTKFVQNWLFVLIGRHQHHRHPHQRAGGRRTQHFWQQLMRPVFHHPHFTTGATYSKGINKNSF